MRIPAVLFTQLWGVLCGGALGAVRTRQATVHLLAKNHLLETAGLAQLPGPGHWEMMNSWAPAWAGGLFFGFSLGLGAAGLSAVWCRTTRALPGGTGRWAPFLLLFVPLTAVITGDPALAACLLAIVLGALAIHRVSQPPRSVPFRWLLVALCGLGVIPWATADEGPFTRLRDQILFASPAGLSVDQFYYRWTLYPAEVLKPLAAKTQPTAAVADTAPPREQQRFCADARRLGILCVAGIGSGAGLDLRVEPGDGGLALVSGDTRLVWPQGVHEQRETWTQFSAARDGARPLRRATGIALFLGCPLGLCWLLTSAALRLASIFPDRRRRRLAALVLTVALSAFIAATGRADPQLAALRGILQQSPLGDPAALAALLDSPRPVERFYAAHAARHLGKAAEPLLINALLDPVINVRYAAAQGLGEAGGDTARTTLEELLSQPEEWYVKERAYASLLRLGWPAK
jgi:hypothetical protein